MDRISVEFSIREESTELNLLLKHECLKEILGGKDFRTIDCIFHFVAAFAELLLVCVETHEQTTKKSR